MHDEAPPAAPDDPTKRAARRIVRSGVLALIGGFATTFVGAVLLGNGPSDWETIGNAVHRSGMFLMLGGLVVVVVGYRWPSISAFLDAPPAANPHQSSGLSDAGPRDVHELLDSLPTTTSTATTTMNASGGGVNAPSTQPFALQNANMSPSSLPTTKGTPPPPSRSGCMIAGWSLFAIVFLLAAIPYWFGTPRDAVVISFVLDSLLLVALTIFAIELSGRWRAVVFGALVPLTFMELVKTIQFFAAGSAAIYGGRYGNPWGLRAVDVVLHLGLIVFALFGGFVHASIDFIRRRRSQGPRS